jgi:succinyl-diaminopimelate desuccinylase
MIDPVQLTADLIRCPTVTPAEGGALQLLDKLLAGAGFRTQRVDRNGVSNLFARWGAGRNGPTFGFNGHVDVVPIGNRDDWTHDPFGGEIVDGILYGRGAVDMKSGVAAFAAAAIDLIAQAPPDGSIVLTIAGDEEAIAKDGTIAILDWMQAHGERMDHCLVGEPTCPDRMGQMMKIGRRGSISTRFTARGVQGHSAYPERARNPLPVMVRLLARLDALELDKGNAHFQPSSLVTTGIDTGNKAGNVIPATCTAQVNIRFNDMHNSADLDAMLKGHAAEISRDTGVIIEVVTDVTGESFITQPGEFTSLVRNAVTAESGVTPEYSTTGGTSDARFVKDHCPVVEFGLVGRTMHSVDECVAVADIVQLKSIYTRILREYFA